MTHEQALILLLPTQVGDAVTTMKIFGEGGRKLNPVIRWLMDQTSPLAALVIKGIALLALAYQMPAEVVLVMAALSACVVAWNITQIKKGKK